MTTSYSYALANDTRLSQIAHNLSGSANDLTLTFGWTPASQLKERTASNNAYSWTSHYAEDLTATLNGLNQVTAFGAAITYDARGNLVTDGTSTFVYDPQNRLTSATVPSGAATLRYDALGRLYEVVKTGAGGSTARFLYSGPEVIAEYDAAGLKTRFVRGQAPDEVLVQYDGGAPLTGKRWLIADERGSIAGGANSSGASQFKNAYDEYGRPSPANTGRFQYTGQMWLAEVGLYHYKARLYSPGLGRFLQTDPVGYADGLNLYAYVGGDPVNNIDPSGLLGQGFTLFTGTCVPQCNNAVNSSAPADEIVVSAKRTLCLTCVQSPALPEFGRDRFRGNNLRIRNEFVDGRTGRNPTNEKVGAFCPVVEGELSIGGQLAAGAEGVGGEFGGSLGGRLDLTSIRAIASTRGGALDVTQGLFGTFGLFGFSFEGGIGRRGALIQSTAPGQERIRDADFELQTSVPFAGFGLELAVLGGFRFEFGLDLPPPGQACPQN